MQLISIISGLFQLKSYIFLPLFLLAMCTVMRMHPKKALPCCVWVGTGLLGVSCVSTLLSDTLAPLVVQVQQHWHLQYQALDIGSAPASITAFSLPFAPLLLPLLLGINLILVRKQWVQTLHIDLFNYWFYLITAGFAYQVSGSLATAILAALAHSVITLLLADYSAEQVCSFTGMNNISVPHGFAAATIPLLLGLNRLFMRILPKKHTRKVGRIAGIWNNPACIGLLFGAAFALLAGCGFAELLQVAMKTAAMMVLFPEMLHFLIDGLLPISNHASVFFTSRLKLKNVRIGIGSSLLAANQDVLRLGFCMIPVLLLLSVCLPGNTTLPLGELPFAAYYVCYGAVLIKGTGGHRFLACAFMMPIVLWIASWAAPYFTQLCAGTGVELGVKGQLITTLALGNRFLLFFTVLSRFHLFGDFCILLIMSFPIYRRSRERV